MTTLLDFINGNTPTPTAPAQPITPVDLAIPLMDFQRDALKFILRGEPHTLASLQMGLGKTPIGIAAIASAHAAGVGPALVVCPATLVFNWQREFAKFAPHLRVAALSGEKPYPIPDVDACIMSEAVVKDWAESLLNKFRVLIVDESHMFKNPKAVRTKALAQVASTVDTLRVLMTGTPNPKGTTEEFVGQFNVLGDVSWRDIKGKGHFYSRFCPKMNSWGTRGSAHLTEFGDLLKSTFMVRMLRSEVLPGFREGDDGHITKGRSAVLFQCDDKFAKDYCRAEDDLREFLRGEGRDVRGYDKAQALVTLNVMRQLAGMAKINPTISHVKNVLDNIDGGVFVVAEHSEVIDRLALGLSKYDPVVINGSTSKKGREEAVDAFTNGDSRVMVGQVKAAGVGLTLHGGGINHRVVIAQLPWNPSDLLQAEDRLYRHGQTKDVDIEVCLSAIDGRWTIDERLWGRLEAKQFDTEMILDGEGSYLLYDPTDDILDSYRD